MRRTVRKYLHLFMALALALLSVTQAPADVHPSLHSQADHHAGMMHAGHMQGADAQSPCDHCDTTMHSCDSHCGACITTLLAAPLCVAGIRAPSTVPTPVTGTVAHLPYQLFRPPRA